ncbi:MAG: hypothetical protein JXA78_08115 [Anaerolineales bacterium]|nr:hypothetical protein [Anaerolineales bacterium]
MKVITLLTRVPLVDLALIAALALALILVARLALRHFRRAKCALSAGGLARAPSGRLPRVAMYAVRLVGFGLLSLLVIGGGVMFYEVYRGVSREIAPAPSQVEIPADLSFQVEEISFEGGEGLRLAGWFAPPAMIEIIGRIAPRPVMLVGGGTVRPYLASEALQVRRYAEYAGANAGVWIIEEAYHCDGPERRPQEYAERLVDFFDRAFDLK